MKRKKTVLDSHELFCEELKEHIKTLEKNKLELFLSKYKNRTAYLDYYNIYLLELEKRNKL